MHSSQIAIDCKLGDTGTYPGQMFPFYEDLGHAIKGLLYALIVTKDPHLQICSHHI